ncbi:hypothetical protein [Hymenobacter metallilatus]|uniref:Uncharacterized protein n=1 Tax=Hymenobacter metallilatus TaxID=2493666 RepID=A0A3R9MTQ8_9BACT|nr:hypothetical protein [Hymenobacter metallilatus]RSK29757.1 hypothetical protein EI290_15565 [Hymenobacter metallilatus]
MVTTAKRRRKLGIEPPAIDLTPIASHPYTEVEAQEITAFFQQKKIENDKLPQILALREAVSRRQKNK